MALAPQKPALIVCDISGYGGRPYRDKKAYDLLIRAKQILSVTGTEQSLRKLGRRRRYRRGHVLLSSILAALLERNKTGRGQHLDISMLESLVSG